MNTIKTFDPTGIKILLIGHSRIARRLIIPALAANHRVSRIDIASRNSPGTVNKDLLQGGTIYYSYEKALLESPADIVYVSLVNSDHAEWTEKSLKSGRHVIVDKPAVTKYEDAIRLLTLARQQKKALIEATVFSYHPQIDAIAEEFSTRNLLPKRITALFSFPPLASGDFRYQTAYGGGAIHDLGPYALGAGSEFFKEQPDTIFCHINSRTHDDLETSFSMTAVYPNGCSMVGHFGFDTEYQNTISVLGQKLCVHCDRVFTIPTDYENTLTIRHNNENFERTIAPANCFLNFFNRVFDACTNRDYTGWYERFQESARSLDLLKKAANRGIQT